MGWKTNTESITALLEVFLHNRSEIWLLKEKTLMELEETEIDF